MRNGASDTAKDYTNGEICGENGWEVSVRELLYSAAEHYQLGKALDEQGNWRGALNAYSDALRDLHAVKPQRMRNALLAQVYLSRYQVAKQLRMSRADSDLRLGYSYARTTREPAVRELAETLWKTHLDERDTRERAEFR